MANVFTIIVKEDRLSMPQNLLKNGAIKVRSKDGAYIMSVANVLIHMPTAVKSASMMVFPGRLWQVTAVSVVPNRHSGIPWPHWKNRLMKKLTVVVKKPLIRLELFLRAQLSPGL